MTSTLTRLSRSSILIILLIACYIATFSIFTIERYERYNAMGWDLGIYSQLTWNAAHGRFMQNTIAEQDNFLGIHAEYVTILLAPTMRVWADPRMLLIVQTIILAVGAWPIARLTRRTFSYGWISVLFAALWLIYPALGWINRWDIHGIAPTTTLFAFAFEAADRRAWRQTDLWLLLALLCKEEIGLNVAAFASFMAWRYHRRWTVCLVWVVVGITWFVGHAFFLFPALSDVESDLPIHAVRYEWLIHGDWQQIADYLAGPVLRHKLVYLVQLLLPLAFLPLFAPIALIPALPTLALSLLSAYEAQGNIYMHYNAPVIPALFAAAIFGLAALARRLNHGLRIGVFILCCTSLAAWIIYNPLFGASDKSRIYGWEATAHIDALNEAKKLIPADACVVAENNIQPHYTMRRETYVIGVRGPGPVGDRDGCDYMIVDLGDHRFDDFAVNEAVACYQFWSQKRVPIYFRDTVVVLRWGPADADPEAWQQMDAYCAAYGGGSN